MTGREPIEGHDTILATLTPKPGVKPRTDGGKIMQHFRAKAWISESDYELVRVEIEAIDALSFGLGLLARVHKGTVATYQRRKVNDEVWLPAQVTWTASGRRIPVEAPPAARRVRVLELSQVHGRDHHDGGASGSLRRSLFVVGTSASGALDVGALLLRGQTLLSRDPAWLRGLADAGFDGGPSNQFHEPYPRGLAVHGLCAVLAAVECQYAVSRHTASGQRDESGFDVRGQRRSADVEAQFHRRGDLVDVLSAGSRSADETLLDLVIAERDRGGDRNHPGVLPATVASATGSVPGRAWPRTMT